MRYATYVLGVLGIAACWIAGWAGMGTGVLVTAGVLGLAPQSLPASTIAQADTFEIVLPGNQPRMEMSEPLLLEADGLMVPPQYGLVELRRGSVIVGLFQVHQILLVANRSLRGKRTFVIDTAQGSHTISADRMQTTQQNGPVLFWVGEELAGVAQSSQVLLITDRASRVGDGGA